MIQQTIHIDEEKCDGCGICADGCQEGAIEMIDGKAKYVGEDFYDCFVYCLPECPVGAITFDEQESSAYVEAAMRPELYQITKGTSDTTFSPSDTCTRGQIVTFLYRAFN